MGGLLLMYSGDAKRFVANVALLVIVAINIWVNVNEPKADVRYSTFVHE
jgi:hypothetical protein